MRKAHATIEKVTNDIGARFAFNTAESAVHELVNMLQGAADATPEQRRFAAATAVSLVQPYAPHIACELWERLGGERLWEAPWPAADPEMLVSDQVTYAVQVNGKLRGEVTVDAGLGRDEILAAGAGSAQRRPPPRGRDGRQGDRGPRPPGQLRDRLAATTGSDPSTAAVAGSTRIWHTSGLEA